MRCVRGNDPLLRDVSWLSRLAVVYLSFLSEILAVSMEVRTGNFFCRIQVGQSLQTVVDELLTAFCNRD